MDLLLATPTTHRLRTHPQPGRDFLDRLELGRVIRQGLLDHTHRTLAELRRILTWHSSILPKEAELKPGRFTPEFSHIFFIQDSFIIYDILEPIDTAFPKFKTLE